MDRSNIRDQSRRRQEARAQAGRRTVGNSEDGLSPEEDHGDGKGDEDDDDDDEDDDDELGENPRKKSSHRGKAGGNIVFSKAGGEDEEPLPSPIRSEYDAHHG